MGWIICGVVLPSCLGLAWWIVRKPLRTVVEELQVDQARLLFRQSREWLEARFLTAMAKSDPVARLRWEDAHWHDTVHWARDNQTRNLLAMVEVDFGSGPGPTDDVPIVETRHATALFEYRKGRWFADGKRLDATRPDQVLLDPGRFEPVVAPPHRRA